MSNNNYIYNRSVTISNASIKDKEERLIEVSFSSENPYTRDSVLDGTWIEILGHNIEEVDLSRINNKAPVLYNHDRTDKHNRIGVVQSAWLDINEHKGKAILKISKREEINGIWKDIQDGILCNVSVGYLINRKELIDSKETSTYRVTDWVPIEISLVDIPADYSVGIGRIQESSGENKFKFNTNFNIKSMIEKEEITDSNINNNTIANNQVLNKTNLKQELLNNELKRRMEVKNIFAPFNRNDNFKELYETCLIDMNISTDNARIMLLNELGKNKEPINNNIKIELVETQQDKTRNFITEALEFKSGLGDKDKNYNNELRSYTLTELARLSLESNNIKTTNLTKQELVGRAFTNSSSDFPIILSNIADKSLLKGYSEYEEIYEKFTNKGNLSDFKIHERFAVSELNNLEKVYEGGKYKYDTFDERKETIQLETFGKMFCITRQAIINDDMSVFTTIPQRMGRSAKRTIANKVFDIIINNTQKMSDNLVVFENTKHKNYLTGSNASAPSIDSLSNMRNIMRRQKDFSNSKLPLNIKPQYVLVPTILEDKLKVLLTSETDPRQDNSKVPNPIRNILEVLSDARLDEASETAWYMFANPQIHDLIEIAYLDGNSNPILEEQRGWDVDGVEYKIRIDFGIKCMDFRTMIKNDGSNS